MFYENQRILLSVDAKSTISEQGQSISFQKHQNKQQRLLFWLTITARLSQEHLS